MKTWNGKDLKGVWTFTRKLDGVCVVVKEDGSKMSRKGKPLYNMDHLQLAPGIYEIFMRDRQTSISAVRTKNDGDPVPRRCLFELEPKPHRSILITTITDPSAQEVRHYMKQQVRIGYEGLVLRCKEERLKVKPFDTFDVEVLGIEPGKGKHKGKVGAYVTSLGNVGTGLTDEDRATPLPIGTIIEVRADGLTPDGKFDFPRFVRARWDK